jgi:hypothetical protein
MLIVGASSHGGSSSGTACLITTPGKRGYTWRLNTDGTRNWLSSSCAWNAFVISDTKLGSVPKRASGYTLNPADSYAACTNRGCAACDFDGTCSPTKAPSPSPPYVLPPWNSTEYMEDLTDAVVTYVQTYTKVYDVHTIKKWLRAQHWTSGGGVVSQYGFAWVVSFDADDWKHSMRRRTITRGNPIFLGQNSTCLAKRMVVPLIHAKVYLTISKAACQSGNMWIAKRSLDHCTRMSGRGTTSDWQNCMWYNNKNSCEAVAANLEPIDCADMDASAQQMLGIN